MKLEKFICRSELAAMTPEHKERATTMLENTPELYAQDGQGDNAKVALHYFKGASDWFILELNQETGEGFGFVILNGWYDCAELGYIYIPEIIAAGVELDLYWNQNTTLGEAKREYIPEEFL